MKMKSLLLILILCGPCFNITSAQSRDQIYFGGLTINKFNTNKKINIKDSEQTVISNFGQPLNVINYEQEVAGISMSKYYYDGAIINIRNDYHSFDSFEITSSNYYIGKPGKLLIRVGDPLINLNDFIPISYQNRDLNNHYLYINIINLNDELLDTYVVVFFNSSNIITKIAKYNN